MSKWVTEDEKKEAKKVDLFSYLMACEPGSLKKEGAHDYRHQVHHSLIVSDNGCWAWKSHEMGGRSALKYLTDIQGMHYPDAVVLLLDFMGSPVHSSFQPVTVPEEPAVPFVPPERYSNNSGVLLSAGTALQVWINKGD